MLKTRVVPLFNLMSVLPRIVNVSVDLKYGNRDITESCLVLFHTKYEISSGEPQLSLTYKPNNINVYNAN